MTRLTANERQAIQAELDDARAEVLRLCDEITRLQSMLDAQPAGSDGDTIRLLQPLCGCGLPRDHRNPGRGGEPRPCQDETARIALDDEPRSRPPVPGSVTGDESRPGWVLTEGHFDGDGCVFPALGHTVRADSTL